MTRAILFVFALILSATTLSACNTMEGLGEDVQGGGEVIEGAAHDNNPSNN